MDESKRINRNGVGGRGVLQSKCGGGGEKDKNKNTTRNIKKRKYKQWLAYVEKIYCEKEGEK